MAQSAGLHAISKMLTCADTCADEAGHLAVGPDACKAVCQAVSRQCVKHPAEIDRQRMAAPVKHHAPTLKELLGLTPMTGEIGSELEFRLRAGDGPALSAQLSLDSQQRTEQICYAGRRFWPHLSARSPVPRGSDICPFSPPADLRQLDLCRRSPWANVQRCSEAASRCRRDTYPYGHAGQTLHHLLSSSRRHQRLRRLKRRLHHLPRSSRQTRRHLLSMRLHRQKQQLQSTRQRQQTSHHPSPALPRPRVSNMLPLRVISPTPPRSRTPWLRCPQTPLWAT